MRDDRVDAIRYAGMLHDVGKLGVPTKRAAEDRQAHRGGVRAIQLHPMRGLEIVREIELPGRGAGGDPAPPRAHRRPRLPDGAGRGRDPRVRPGLAVADAFDSMTSTRSYRGARPVDEAIEELQRCKGTQFDPVMVDALVAGPRRARAGRAPRCRPRTRTSSSMLARRSFADDDDPASPRHRVGAAVSTALRRIDDARGTALVVGAALLVAVVAIVVRDEPPPGPARDRRRVRGLHRPRRGPADHPAR